LGITLQELGKLEEAEASYKQAIALKLDLTEAHCNLGNTLQALGRLDEAEASYNQAIALKPDLALAHYGLGTVLCIKGDEDLALKSLINAHEIDPQSKAYELLLTVMKARKSLKGSEVAVGNTSNVSALPRLISSPLVLKRAVEPELIASLYDMHSIRLDKAKDARYGNGITSPDFNLFENAPPIIQKAAEDLTRIMMMALKSNIYIDDSFFNILKAGGGTKPHNHLNILDKNIALDLGRQKYSLVYYLSVGDQSCSDPGILRLHEPSEEIFPCAGMIIIIPASRKHSASYNGKLDRVMIGVNFYSV
jgi:tetratricopeptide (TPR) repeat protein